MEILDKVLLSFKKVDLNFINEKKKKLDSLRPLSEGALKSLEEKLRIDEVYNSTAIEGNTLTLGETALVLEKGITVEGKPLKDHLEVVGYDSALKFVREIVSGQEKYSLTEDLIRKIHGLMFEKMRGLEEEYEHGIGFYRKNQCFIKGSRHVLPRPEKVPELMSTLMGYFKKEEPRLHPISYACLWHFGFTHIHPFADGNGRVARLIMNLLLMRGGYPITVLPVKKRAKYIEALEKASLEHNGEDFLRFILEAMEDTFELYFSIA